MIAKLLHANSRYLALVILAVVVVGYTSMSGMARKEDPAVTPWFAKVQILFPGASPARVEALVTKPMVDALREEPDVSEVDGRSAAGVSLIFVEVDYKAPPARLTQIMAELRDVVDRVGITLPTGTSPPDFDDELWTEFVKIIAITGAEDRPLSAAQLRRQSLLFADAARGVSMTRRVMLYGLPTEEVRVQLNETKLSMLGISIDEVAVALAEADARTPAGQLTGTGAALTVELTGEFTNLESVRNVIVRGLPDGRAIRISDLGDVVKSEVIPLESVSLSNGQRSVLIAVEMQPGYQVDRYGARFDEFLNAYRASAPHGVSIETSFDQAGYTIERLQSVGKNMLMGVTLVLTVLLITLGWRAAMVVAVILPLCTLMSMIALFYLKIPIQHMSVTGLVVALGLLVDGSIVMTDEIRKRLLNGLAPAKAMKGAVSRMRIPLMSSTLTTVLAFLPLVMLPGAGGDFLGSIAVAVIAMLVSSFILAIAVTPVLASRWLPSGIALEHRWWRAGAKNQRLTAGFRRSLNWSIRNPLGAFALALTLPLTGYLSLDTLTLQFFPGTDRDQMYLDVKLSEGTSIEDSLNLVTQIDKKLRSEALIRRVDWSIGESPPEFYYNLRANVKGVPSWSRALVLTTDENQTDALITRLQREVDREFPAAQILVRGIDQGPPVEAPLEIRLFGPSTDLLKSLGEQFRRRMAALPDITHTKLLMAPAPPKVVFDLDESALMRAGLSKAEVARGIQSALKGRVGGELLEGTERLSVRAILKREEWDSTDDLANIRIPIRNRGSDTLIPAVPLSALGTVSLEPDESPIARKNGDRLNSVQGYLKRGVLPEEALKMLARDLEANPIPLPSGYRLEFGGDSQERGELVEDLTAPLGTIVAAMLATILLTFNSWRLTGIAFGVTGCSFGLSLLALAAFQYPLGIQALIGVIGSVGVSINAAIIILSGLKLNERATAGDPDAIVDVVMDASRHIVSTTVTTFGGFLPLILEGSQFWPPFAMAIAGGVLLSTIVSFYLVPPLYTLLMHPRRHFLKSKPQQELEMHTSLPEAA
ncbi:MAG: efflux RND transporter permease subunit [Luminiphilus sp.]|nr:efflux RND transporter permease subunit [Luminiphilus sp.]